MELEYQPPLSLPYLTPYHPSPKCISLSSESPQPFSQQSFIKASQTPNRQSLILKRRTYLRPIHQVKF